MGAGVALWVGGGVGVGVSSGVDDGVADLLTEALGDGPGSGAQPVASSDTAITAPIQPARTVIRPTAASPSMRREVSHLR